MITKSERDTYNMMVGDKHIELNELKQKNKVLSSDIKNIHCEHEKSYNQRIDEQITRYDKLIEEAVERLEFAQSGAQDDKEKYDHEIDKLKRLLHKKDVQIKDIEIEKKSFIGKLSNRESYVEENLQLKDDKWYMQKQINNLTANNDKLYARIKALEVQFKYKETVIEEKDNQN